MRLIVGIDCDGHQFAVRVDTLERLKMYFVETLMRCDKDLALKAAMVTSEEELLQGEFKDAMIDQDGFGRGRDTFTNLYDPMAK